jgi:ribosome-binding factor A
VRAETAPDLTQTKIYVSVFEKNKEDKKEIMKVLKNSAGYIRKLLAERINLRKTPEVIFVLDESLDYSEKINNLIKDLKIDEAPKDGALNESAGKP